MTLPIFAQIGLVLLWVIFIIELFTMTTIMAHNKLAVVIWASARILPLLLVTMGVV